MPKRKVWLCVPGWFDATEVYGTEEEAKAAFVVEIDNYIHEKRSEDIRFSRSTSYWDELLTEIEEVREKGDDLFDIHFDIAMDQYDFEFSGVFESIFHEEAKD